MNGGLPEVRVGSAFPAPFRPQAATATASAEYADAQRKAQSAAAIYKLKQSSAHGSSDSGGASSSTTSSPGSAAASSSTVSISEPFSKIVAGGSASSARAPSPDLTMAEKLTESNHRSSSAPVPPVAEVPEVKSEADVSRKPNLHVDTSSVRESATEESSSVAAAATTIVGPLEALKLATGGSSSQGPAWAQPFPSPSVVLHSEQDDSGVNDGSVFSPFGLGFDGGIHRGGGSSVTMQDQDHMWGVASAFKDNNHENDPMGTNSVSSNDVIFSSPPPPPPLPRTSPSGGGSGSSSLSFASIDAIFSHRTESSEALAGLLGVQLSTTPLSHGNTPQAKNSRSSRFAFANHSSGLDIPSSPAPPSSLNGSGRIPSSPFGNSMMDPPSSRRAPPSPFGYGAAVGGLGGSGGMSSSSFASMHQDSSAFPPLGSHHSLHHQHHAAPDPFGNSVGGFGGSSSLHQSGLGMNSDVGVGSGLAFLQQMLPNVNISFGGDYPSHSNGDGGSGLFPSMGSSNGPTPPLPPPSSAWSGGNMSSLGFDSSSSSRLAAANSASGYYDPAIATLAPPPSSSGGFFGLGSSLDGSSSDRDRHHMHSGIGGGVYRHPGSILNNGN